MQSFLQFRQAGLAASAQVERGHEKAGHGTSRAVTLEGHTRPASPQQPLQEVGLKPPIIRSNKVRIITAPILQSASPENQDSSTPSSSNSGGIFSDNDIEVASGVDTTVGLGRRPSAATALGRVLTGVLVRNRDAGEGAGGHVFLVGWDGPDDRLNPRNWSVARRAAITILISLIGCVVGVASAIDATVLPQAAEDLGVSEVAESMATGA